MVLEGFSTSLDEQPSKGTATSSYMNLVQTLLALKIKSWRVKGIERNITNDPFRILSHSQSPLALGGHWP